MSDDLKRYLNAETALARVRGNKVLYIRMLGMFTGSEEFGHFEDAIGSGDISKAADSAHTIKGMAGNLSLDAVAELSEKLMIELRAGGYDAATLTEYREALVRTNEIIAEYVETESE